MSIEIEYATKAAILALVEAAKDTWSDDPHHSEDWDLAQAVKVALEGTLVEAVKAHALAHYEDGGWDVVVETYEDIDIAKQVSMASTPDEAIASFETPVSIWADRQADARNSAF